MAIAVRNVTTGNNTGTSLTISHNHNPSNDYQGLEVCIGILGQTTVTGITFNGDAMTRKIHREGVGIYSNYIYYLPNADEGTHNVVVSLSGSAIVYGGAITIDGLATTQNGDTAFANVSSATSISDTVTTTADNSMVIDECITNAALTITSGATQVFNNSNVYRSSRKTVATSGTVTTMSYSRASSGSMSMCCHELLAYVSNATTGTSFSDVLKESATILSCNVDGTGITERGVVVSTSLNPTTSDTKFTVAGTTGSFNAEMTGLTNGTTYHVRAFVTDAVSTYYGADVTFKTIKQPAKVMFFDGTTSYT